VDLSSIVSHPVLALITVLVITTIAFAKAFRGEKHHHARTSAEVRTYRRVADAQMEEQQQEAARRAAAEIDRRYPDLTV
jgi:hypothetical protein